MTAVTPAPSRVPPGKLVSTMVRLSPSASERWVRCPRLYLHRDILGLPASDPGPDAGEGLLVHALLKHIHEHGHCTDDAHVRSVIDGHAVDDTGRLLGFVTRHARRCPVGGEALGHEREFARFHRLPGPIFMATGRIDALWRNGPWLEAHDYKTGFPFVEQVGHDLAARLQAWLIAPLAAAEGLQIRVRYQHLAAEVDDDPQPFEPDAADLDAIEDELRLLVEAIRDERTFTGIGPTDPAGCARCAYRSICADSPHRQPPTWSAPAEPAPADW
jgi:RecB family exonuclease